MSDSPIHPDPSTSAGESLNTAPENMPMPLPDPITGRFDPNDPTVRALAEAALNPDKSKIPRPYKCPLCDRAFYRLEHQVSTGCRDGVEACLKVLSFLSTLFEADLDDGCYISHLPPKSPTCHTILSSYNIYINKHTKDAS
jgi:hypothetical protein